MAKSINRLLAELIDDDGDVQAQYLDNAEGGGLVYYDTLDSLPVGNLLSEGNLAFVQENQRMYVSNGIGWYNAGLVNRTPRWDSGGEPDASYTIADSATPLVITAKAVDSDNSDINLLNQASASDSAQYMVSITNDSSVFTFTPKSADSIGIEVAAGNLSDSNGDFIYTFKWSDGISFVSKAVTIGYSPAGSGGTAGTYGDRAIAVQGASVSGTQNSTTTILYWDITSLGNASTFGNLTTTNRYRGTATGDAIRALWWGGSTWSGSAESHTQEIEYSTIATTGNAQFFGNLSHNIPTNMWRRSNPGSCCNGTKAVIGGGQQNSSTGATEIEVVTVQTTSNGVDHGDLTRGRFWTSAWGNDTYGLWAYGSPPGTSPYGHNSIDRLTIDTGGNATAHGTGNARSFHGAGGDDTRMVIAGGYYTSGLQSIDSVTIATSSNASSHGQLSQISFAIGGLSNSTRTCYFGDGQGASTADEIEYITTATGGTAASFGNLGLTSYDGKGTSGNAA